LRAFQDLDVGCGSRAPELDTISPDRFEDGIEPLYVWLIMAIFGRRSTLQSKFFACIKCICCLVRLETVLRLKYVPLEIKECFDDKIRP
jgi:hypothetical protein